MAERYLSSKLNPKIQSSPTAARSTLLSLGAAFLFGAYEMSSCNIYSAICTFIGLIIIGGVTVQFLWFRPMLNAMRGASVIVIIGFLWVAWDLGMPAYQSSHMSKYVSVHERNRELWAEVNDGGGPNTAIYLGSKDHEVTLVVKNKTLPVLLTPIVANGTQGDTIAPGADIHVTVYSNGAKANFGGP